MAKNIVICCDGTGNEFGNANSNVVKLYRTLSLETEEQIGYYHPGIGTMGAPGAISALAQAWTKFWGQAIGYGIMNNVSDAYGYLMNRYAPGDHVFLFGFSRGAYAVRAVAAMLHMFGLVRRGNEVLIPYVNKMFQKHHKSRDTFALAAEFKDTFSHECKPYFVGVWDTVSSVGWMYDPLSLPYTAYDPDIAHGRHALSIDERRCFFRQNMWVQRLATQDIRQVWFAGVHSDVGGSYPEPESGLAKIALKWMVEEATSVGLLIDREEYDLVLGKTPGKFASPDPSATMHDSLQGFWRILEIFPHRYVDLSGDRPVTRWKIPLGRPRFIPEGSLVHESVVERIHAVPTYRPPNLPAPTR